MNDETGASPRKRTVLTVVCVVGALVAAVVSVSAWYWYSRLNPLERRILGDWSFTRTDKSRGHLHFKSDRTFLCWTSTGAEDSGTWKISGDNLILSFRTIGLGPWPPDSPSTFIRQQVDRFQRPAAWADHVATFTLEDVSPSSVHMRDKQGNAELVFRRVDSVVRSANPR